MWLAALVRDFDFGFDFGSGSVFLVGRVCDPVAFEWFGGHSVAVNCCCRAF